MKNVPQGESASALIDKRIKELEDWRGKTLARVRQLIKQADPEIVEEWKWRGTPTWSHNGIVCTGETYKSVVKMTFAKGLRLRNPPDCSTRTFTGTAGARSTSPETNSLKRAP